MPATLAYAPADPRRRWRFWRRLLIYPLVTGALAFLIPWLWHRVPLLYWQYKCQTYTAPPDQIIISSFPEDIERLKNDPNYSIITDSRTRYVVHKPPECLTQLNRNLRGAFPAAPRHFSMVGGTGWSRSTRGRRATTKPEWPRFHCLGLFHPPRPP